MVARSLLYREFSLKRAKTAGADNLKESQVELVTLPDGLEPEDDRSDVVKVRFSIKSTIPARLPKLIQDINALGTDNSITCIIVTVNMGWALEVYHKLGIKGALVCPASASSLASSVCMPKLIDDGIIDSPSLMQMGIIPHFLCIPYPIQGHVNPLMQLSLLLGKHGCKVTFVHTEFSHKQAKTAGSDNLEGSQIELVTLPDGLEPEDDRSDVVKVLLSIKSNMPALLPKLIEDINALDIHNNITCIIVTFGMGWALEVGHKLGIKGALLCPASASSLALAACIPKLIDDGIIDSQGLLIKKQEIQLAPNMPMLHTQNLIWCGFNKIFFEQFVQEMQTLESGEWWLSNTTYDLEPGAFSISPKFLSIGPLMESESNKSSFWEEDTTCLDWLDQQPPQSVIYVSFGSLAVIDPDQFKELALGLDLLDKPFIWVVRSSNENKKNDNAYPHDFHGNKGKIVGWSPQKKILNHPALACFISHCGWNSTIEGICAGVPFLCWPCASDQYLNKSYICDVWKIGLGLNKDENGIISREEIRKKVDQLLVDEDIKARSLKLKEKTINNILEGGQSAKNLNFFIDWVR